MAIGTATGIGIGLTALGTYLRGRAQSKAGDAAAELAEFNAHVAELQASDAVLAGEEEAQRFRAGVRTLVGRNKAGFAAQGVDIGVGTPLDVAGDTARMGELDVLTIKTNAARAAWGYSVQAENFRRGGSNAQQAARYNVLGTVLGGATSILGQVSDATA